ncbi:MAG: hypothetical protein WKF76_10080 [Nocardioidaceae bacterium]
MESLLRLLVVLAGLPEPQVNFKLRDVDGAVLMRFYPATQLSRSSSSTTDASTPTTPLNGRAT